jgi:hypothetical protein
VAWAVGGASGVAAPPTYPRLCWAVLGREVGGGVRGGAWPGGGALGEFRVLQLACGAAVLVHQVLEQRVLPQPRPWRQGLATRGAGPGAPSPSRAPHLPQAIAAEAVAAGQRGGPDQQPVADDAAQVVLAQPHGDRRAGGQASHGLPAAAAALGSRDPRLPKLLPCSSFPPLPPPFASSAPRPGPPRGPVLQTTARSRSARAAIWRRWPSAATSSSWESVRPNRWEPADTPRFDVGIRSPQPLGTRRHPKV